MKVRNFIASFLATVFSVGSVNALALNGPGGNGGGYRPPAGGIHYPTFPHDDPAAGWPAPGGNGSGSYERPACASRPGGCSYGSGYPNSEHPSRDDGKGYGGHGL